MHEHQTLCVHWSSITARSLALLTLLSRGVEQAVLPNVCVFCGATRQLDDIPVCDYCYSDLPWIENACAQCASPVVTQLPEDVCCAACQQDPPPYEAAVTPLLYAFPVDAAIKAMKFKRKLLYVPAFAHILLESMRRVSRDVDALLPVPLHWRRQALRGFNQAAELSSAIEKKTGLPVLVNVYRQRATRYQSGLIAAQRQRNLLAAFTVRGTVNARHVLIVDDVITTGETCRQLAKTLLDAGAEKVSVLAIARA